MTKFVSDQACSRPPTMFVAFLTAALLAACGGTSTPKSTGSAKSPAAGDVAALVQGGLLWDNVWDATDQPPVAEPNPMYELRQPDPRTSQRVEQAPEDTWRCKECHGWDYKGKDGAYGSGSSHYTGFAGIYARIGSLNRDYIKRYIRDGITTAAGTIHDYGVSGPQLSEDDIDALATFILSGGIVNTDLYVFPKASPLAKAGKCDQGSGKALYESGAPKGVPNCASSGCHGIDGKAIDFDGDPATVEFIGTLSADNPWEMLHKARFGQPGEPAMPAMMTWATIDQACDVMTYTQTLPAE